jgi:hypothetical protein
VPGDFLQREGDRAPLKITSGYPRLATRRTFGPDIWLGIFKDCEGLPDLRQSKLQPSFFRL